MGTRLGLLNISSQPNASQMILRNVELFLQSFSLHAPSCVSFMSTAPSCHSLNCLLVNVSACECINIFPNFNLSLKECIETKHKYLVKLNILRGTGCCSMFFFSLFTIRYCFYLFTVHFFLSSQTAMEFLLF